MTQEEKAKAYDRTLEAVKKLREINPSDKGIQNWVNEYFPELKESEDERIRKSVLIGLIDCRDAPDLMWSDFGGMPIDDCIAWLEKQGENSVKWNENIDSNKPKKHHSVLMKTTHGIAEGEWQGEKWFQYRWSSRLKDDDVLSWIEFRDLEKQDKEVSWKPSKAQIGALEHFVRSVGESGYASPYDSNTKLLNSLINDLYKLEKQGE